jgi:hypothetical protein
MAGATVGRSHCETLRTSCIKRTIAILNKETRIQFNCPLFYFAQGSRRVRIDSRVVAMAKKVKRTSRQAPQSSSEERQDPSSATAGVEHSDPPVERRPPPPDYSAYEEDLPYDSAEDANLSPANRPSSPGYVQEGSASPQSQEKSPPGAASRGHSPGAGNPRSDADAPHGAVFANKSTNSPSSLRDAPHEIINVDEELEGPPIIQSPHENTGGNDNSAGETRSEKLARLRREMQALIEQEERESVLLLNSTSSVVQELSDQTLRGGQSSPAPVKNTETRETLMLPSSSKTKGNPVLKSKGLPEGPAFTALQAESGDANANASATERTLHAEHALLPVDSEQNKKYIGSQPPRITVPAVRDIIGVTLQQLNEPARNPAQKSVLLGEPKERIKGDQTIVGNAGNGLKILGK